jgi:hypothetical protein
VRFCEIAGWRQMERGCENLSLPGFASNRRSFELPSVFIELTDRASFVYIAKPAVDGGRTAI